MAITRVRRDWAEPFKAVRFTLTAEHVALLQAAWVDWEDVEWGAPAIDPKRPYGNGDLDRDLYYALATPEARASVWDDDHGLPAGLAPDEWRLICERNRVLHRETETALQIVLRAGSFTPGVYEAREYHNDWRRVDA